jgi:hypothetical protein
VADSGPWIYTDKHELPELQVTADQRELSPIILVSDLRIR